MRRRLRALLALSAFAPLTLLATGAGATEGADDRDVETLDNVFSPRIVRIAVGGSLRWTNDGRSPHNVIADDGSFRSDVLEPGDAFEEAFVEAGAFPFHCSLHGAPGAGMTGLVLVGDVPIPGAASGV
ncbi:MAG: cupredoxin domain-containing protein, partial [Actinomycetota bacterium]